MCKHLRVNHRLIKKGFFVNMWLIRQGLNIDKIYQNKIHLL